MATSNLNPVAAKNISLEGSKFTIFGWESFLEGDGTRISHHAIGICRELDDDETIADKIEAIIVEDMKTHPVEAIDHILVGRWEASLLFLDGRIGCDQVNGAVEKGSKITLTGVKFKAGGEERGFTVVIRNGHGGYATMNKAGEVL